MYAVIKNTRLGKAVTLQNVQNEEYDLRAKRDVGYNYWLTFTADEDTDTVEKIYNLLDFPIEYIEIHVNKYNTETSEEEDVIGRIITDVHFITNICSNIVTDNSSIGSYVILNKLVFA